MNNKLLLLLFLPAIFAVSCDRVESDPKGDEMARFNAWIDVNNLSSYKTPSGIYFISEKEGMGDFPKDSDLIIYSYVLRDLDGFIYQNTYKDTAKLYDIYGLYKTTTHYVPTINQLVKSFRPKGFAEGLKLMKKGGKARFIMPSSLAFGKYGSGSISKYTSLIYDVEVVDIISQDFETYEKSLIDNYLLDNPGFQLVSDSIYYKRIFTSTSGQAGVKKDSIVKVNYTGRFLDGFIFDTNIKQVALDSNIYSVSRTYTPLKFTVGYYDRSAPLPSFQLAIKQMIQGDKAIVIIPSKYMYGASGSYSGETTIPPFTPLIFELELVDVIGKK